ncbi:hypothetical protein CLV35_0851 [Motilibacter peucedani]|uniref:Secreted protein n=1 Tax=Motilibacter peucedani TaxID=598650 RepID=A0A420XUT9_9ACTN|nr:hypothetical protein [Motilibacter peucedani]RKS80419.1 hypothetical protein CLV35_0851 [Motilibacter peucedani]
MRRTPFLLAGVPALLPAVAGCTGSGAPTVLPQPSPSTSPGAAPTSPQASAGSLHLEPTLSDSRPVLDVAGQRGSRAFSVRSSATGLGVAARVACSGGSGRVRLELAPRTGPSMTVEGPCDGTPSSYLSGHARSASVVVTAPRGVRWSLLVEDLAPA